MRFVNLLQILLSLLRDVLRHVRLRKTEKKRGASGGSSSGLSLQEERVRLRSLRSFSGSEGSSEAFPYQTDSYFSWKHNKWGCYFQGIARIAWDEGGFDGHLRRIIKKTAKYCVREGCMLPDYFVQKPTCIFEAFGLRVIFLGWKGPEYVCEPNERELLRMEWEGEHFVVGDGASGVAWDPWPNSQTVAHGRVVDKRVFRVLGTTDAVIGVKNG